VGDQTETKANKKRFLDFLSLEANFFFIK